jgi:hypothetical protein
MNNPLSGSLKNWIETNLPTFLTSLPLDPDSSSAPWKMPVIEDYILVVAVKDYADGGVGVFSISNDDSQRYRMRGLLAEALD